MKKWIKRLIIISSIFFFFPVLLLIILIGGESSLNGGVSNPINGIVYVEHWTAGDAYTNNFMHQRYGITAEQIEGFIQSQGFPITERSSGKKFLYYQEISGIDVRVLMAKAQMESGYGTAGVAKQFPNSNMWGYGAFDSNPNNGGGWSSEMALADFKKFQIETLRNTSFKIMDDRAIQYKMGTLQPGQGVYYTDTSGSGKARAMVMEQIDKWIDSHGGTPKPPVNSVQPITGGGELASSWNFPSEYVGKLKYGQPSSASLVTQIGSGYPIGQCTWYVYNRMMEIGMISVADGYGYLGNGQDWVGSLVMRGWRQIPGPQVGAVLSEHYGDYGHVAFVEHVNADGSFLISECNYAGNQTQVHFRVMT